MPCVRIGLRCVDLNPVALSKTPVDEDLRTAVRARNNCAICATDRTPHYVRRATGNSAVSGLEADALGLAKLFGVGHNLVVDGELVGVGDSRTTAVFVSHDKLSVWQLGDGGHAWAVSVLGVCDIVDNWAPCLEVCSGLMDHLLAVSGVLALVRVVADQLLVVQHQEGLPDRCQAVVRTSFTTGCNMRDEGPGQSRVSRCVKFNMGAGEVLGDG